MAHPLPRVVQHRYLLDGPLGQGGVASTYRAQDLLLGRMVALKLLELDTPSAIAEFRREFSRLSGLYHPRLVQALDFGLHREGGAPLYFSVAQLVEGSTLADFARDATWRDLSRPLVDAVTAMGFLHRLGLRHGDFKPENILVDRRGRGVLVDLGCARPLHQAPLDSEANEAQEPLSGTAGFLAPELRRGQRGDARSDLFALGRTLDWVSKQVRIPRAVVELAQQLQAPEPVNRPVDVAEVLERMGEEEVDFAPSAGRAPRLLGREAELRRFDEFLSGFLDGQSGSRCLYLYGPQGVGRSRLAEELKWRAQQRLSVAETPQGAEDEPMAALVGFLARYPLGSSHPPVPALARVDIALVERVQALLAGGDQPWLLVVDDADRLSSSDHELLHSLLRLSEPTDRLALICTGREQPPALPQATVETWSLSPLTLEDIRQWASSLVSPAYLEPLLERSQGLPSRLEFLLAEISSGRLHEADLAGTATTSSPRAEALNLSDLPGSAQRALGLVALLGAQLDQAAQDYFGLEQNTWAILHQRRWIRPRESMWHLWREPDAQAVVAALPRELGLSLHRDAATWLAERLSQAELTPRRASSIVARQVTLLATGEALSEAEELALAQESLVDSNPMAWREPTQLLATSSARISVLLVVADMFQRAGHPERGLELLESLDQRRLDDGERILLCCHQASCRLKLGQAKEALRCLNQVDVAEEGGNRLASARHAELLTRILIQLGRYDEALSRALEALAADPAEEWATLLHEDVGLAASYLGKSELARSHLHQALELQQIREQPRASVRLLSSQGIHHFREGRLEEASAAYRAALELAEEHGLSDMVASAALNMGTAAQQRGDWGPALKAYERGLRLARAVGKSSTEVALRYNLANLLAEIGRFNRAEKLAQLSLEGARAVGIDYVDGAVPLLCGEIALEQGRYDVAQAWLNEAQQHFSARRAAREQTEVQMRFIELALTQGQLQRSRQLWAELQRQTSPAIATALSLPMALLRGRLQLAEGDAAQAVTSFEEAQAAARESGQHDKIGESSRLLSEAYTRLAEEGVEGERGLWELAESKARESREVWSRIALSLPRPLQEHFWRHPRRVAVSQDPEPPARTRVARDRRPRETDRRDQVGSSSGSSPRPAQRPDDSRAWRLLEINRRLNSTLSTDRVLEFALDTAIDLVGAERGFILLSSGGEQEGRDATATAGASPSTFEVAVARNLDQKSLEHPEKSFSRSIATQVIATGEPLVTVDAQQDERFSSNRSVHAMKLTSVCAVPIRVPTGVLGALYLDNRFQLGRFEESSEELLLAFADQVALTLRNAQLLTALQRRTEQLEREKEKVEALSEQQAKQIDLLTEEVQARQDVLELRYDYSNIIGNSPPMRRVLATVDRVIDSTLNVLVEGESGTGKELIARAIHFNGPRRDQRFLSLNCAALPDSLLESELFGYRRGAFTHADRDQDGLFLQAHGGTLFLDEVGETSLAMQTRLLRVLQEREVTPLGAAKPIAVDFRLVCATNRHLRDEVAAGRFREDLFYRIAVVEITLPPLRERGNDVLALAQAILERLAAESGSAGTEGRVRPKPNMSRDVQRALLRYAWPGNVRQLENVLNRAWLFADDSRLTVSDLEFPQPSRPLERARDRKEYEGVERQRILEALTEHRWNICEASRVLGIPRTTLYRKLKQYRLSRPDA